MILCHIIRMAGCLIPCSSARIMCNGSPPSLPPNDREQDSLSLILNRSTTIVHLDIASDPILAQLPNFQLRKSHTRFRQRRVEACVAYRGDAQSCSFSKLVLVSWHSWFEYLMHSYPTLDDAIRLTYLLGDARVALRDLVQLHKTRYHILSPRSVPVCMSHITVNGGPWTRMRLVYN